MTAAAVRYATVRPAPRREPPFDDELAAERPPLRLVRGLELELPFPDPHVVTPLQVGVRPSVAGDPELWARRLLLGLSEYAAGRRPLHQLAPIVNPLLLRSLGANIDRARTAPGGHWLRGAAIRSLRLSTPADGVAEVAAVLNAGRRVRAMALRLEVRHGRWQCVQLQMA
ncbi:MAG: Rv3235 family protein [Jatrophihabitans sp.]|uniref:Rv3235 family protein n=1 Tax=Jatrophihabitans sp. TaxID=1932789 RepID=UPI003F7E894A